MASLTLTTPVRPSRATARMAGHTVSTVLSRSTVLMNTPMTFIPPAVSGSGAGMTQNAATMARHTRILTSFAVGIDSFCCSISDPSLSFFAAQAADAFS